MFHPGASVRVLAEAGKSYAVYVHHGRVVSNAKPRYQVDRSAQEIDLRLDLPGGVYVVDWLHPRSSARSAGGRVQHAGGVRSFTSPGVHQRCGCWGVEAMSGPLRSARQR